MNRVECALKTSLNGKWQFRQLNSDEFSDAFVPGCNYLDLMENKAVPDPFYGCNETGLEWVAEKDWEYIKNFRLSDDELKCDALILHFDMLDTICEVYLNDIKIGDADNCHISYDFNVTGTAVSGQNTLRVIFRSPVEYVKKMRRKVSAPINSNGMNGIVHIRKPQCHFGWDWGPVLPLSGVTGDVWIESVVSEKIDDIVIRQKHCDGKVTLGVFLETERFSESDNTYRITLGYPDGSEYTAAGKETEFLIEKPDLWWTYELSGKDEQPMYTVTAEIVRDGNVLYSLSKKTGLRTIELDRGADEFGTNFRFILNGVPLFIKGANYIPADSFMTRFDGKRLDSMLDCARFSNLNMIRIWGGGYYGSDEMYDECDRRGILLWQDFCFACQAYPFFLDSFLDNVKKEIRFNVKRLSSHPSLALWSGNNEIEEMSAAWMWKRRYIKWTGRFFYDILPEEMRKYDPYTPYSPGSPAGTGFGKDIRSDNHGDTHIWGVWHGLKPMTFYRSRPTRFCSEFGFECLPDMKTVSSFAGKDELRLDSAPMISHQKCSSGNDKILYYLVSRFRIPKEFDNLVYLSQITQQECIRDATEFWRRNKGRCNGSMYWQFNDCWPCVSWSGYDYYGGYKALQYTARHFNAPLTLSFDDSDNKVRLLVLNDYDRQIEAEVRIEIFDFSDGALSTETETVVVGKTANIQVAEFSTAELKNKYDLGRTGIFAELISQGNTIESKTLLFDSERNLSLPEAAIEKEMFCRDGYIEIALVSDSFARAVCLESSVSYNRFSDNYFDLLPGMKKTVTIAFDPKYSPEELEDSITVKSISDVRGGYTDEEELRIKNKVFRSPLNILNCISHGQKGDGNTL